MRDLFKGGKVMLTAPRQGDFEAQTPWYQDSDFCRQIDTDIAYPRSAEELANFAAKSANAFTFHIRLAKNEELIGFIALHSIEWNNQCGTLSMGIGRAAHRGRGYAAEAMALLLQFAFCELNLHRVGLDYIEYNQSAAALYQRAGFTEEGRARECVYRDGHRYDRVHMGILRPQWELNQAAQGGGV